MASCDKPFVAVVGIDYSEAADVALEAALDFCLSRPQSVLHIVNVVPLLPRVEQTQPLLDADDGEWRKELRRRLAGYLHRRIGTWHGKLPERIVPHLRCKEPALEIAKLASDVRADLIVVGTHRRRGLLRLLQGSVAEELVRTAPCPVLVASVRTEHLTQPPAVRQDPHASSWTAADNASFPWPNLG